MSKHGKAFTFIFSLYPRKVILISMQFERNITEETSIVECWWCIKTRDNMLQMKVRLISSSPWKRNAKIPKDVTNVTWNFLWKAVWRNIWKHTMGRGQTNATNVTMSPVMQALWGHTWKHTLEQSQTNATSVTLPLIVQAIWMYIWKCTLEKSQTNATNVTMH